MAIEPQDFLDMSLEELAEMFPGTACSVCEQPIDSNEDQRYKIGDKPACGDCYYGAFSDFLDTNPIYHPHARG